MQGVNAGVNAGAKLEGRGGKEPHKKHDNKRLRLPEALESIDQPPQYLAGQFCPIYTSPPPPPHNEEVIVLPLPEPRSPR